MANSWYVSSAAYTAVTQFAISTTYAVGQIVRSLAAPANGSKGVFRCTTGGVSGGTEASWSQTNGATTPQGTAIFTTITGNSTYGWSAAAGDLYTATNAAASSGFAACGDTIYVSSDHSESFSNPTYFSSITGSWNATTYLISVNRGGSVPPAAGDVTSGASFTASAGSMYIDPAVPVYVDGCTLATTVTSIYFNSGSLKGVYLRNCALQLNGTSSSNLIGANNPAKVTWDNTTARFGNTGQYIGGSSYIFDLTWINTPSAIQGATIPTTLIKQSANGSPLVTCRGVDLSALTTTLVNGATYSGTKVLLDSCKIASGATIYGGTPAGQGDIVELVNCYDGTNTRNERYTSAGTVKTERTITLSGGAADDIGSFSFKMVSNATGIDKWAFPLECFWFDVENTVTGASKTATIEIVSSASLNNDDVSAMLEYMGTSGSPVASFAWNLPTTPLTAKAAITTSSATWNSSPSTPVYQKIQITFTPQVAGRVRGVVRLGKISTTVYVNPVITIT